jgi:hypothetical protein
MRIANPKCPAFSDSCTTNEGHAEACAVALAPQAVEMQFFVSCLYRKCLLSHLYFVCCTIIF